MDITSPLSILLRQGTGYVLFVLSCFVIFWLIRRLFDSYDRRLQDITTMKDAYNSLILKSQDIVSENNHRTEELAATSTQIAQNVQQLIMRRDTP